MGDSVEELNTGRRIFYDFTSNCLLFSVRASGNAIIGLSEEPLYPWIIYWVYICENGNSGIRRFDEDIVNISTPEILDCNVYKKFWLTTYNSKLELGKFGEDVPIFSKDLDLHRFKYITFSKSNENTIVDWRFLVRPKIERPILKSIAGGKPYWVPYDGLLPYGALIGGYENEFLYIMRAPHEGNLTTGKFVPSMKCGFVAWGSHNHRKTEFEILCAHDCIWIPTGVDGIPVGAFAAGYEGIESLYIGRVFCDGHLIPGTVVPSHRGCYIAYHNDSAYETEFEVLVCPHSNPKRSYTKPNPTFLKNIQMSNRLLLGEYNFEYQID